MSLFIEVKVGSKDNNITVARSKAWNVSDLADISDYEFEGTEYGNPDMGIKPRVGIKGEIKGHERMQSVWSLVEKIAGMSK